MSAVFPPLFAGNVFHLGSEIGALATRLQFGGDPACLQGLSRRLNLLDHANIPYNDLDSRLSAIASGEPLLQQRTVDLLLHLEGRITGELVSRNSLPEEEKEYWETAVAGLTPPDPADIFRAHRQIRGPWIRGFLEATGIIPGGSSTYVDISLTGPFDPVKELLGRNVYLKLEGLQRSSSVKIRGATNLLVGLLLTGRRPSQVRLVTAASINQAKAVFDAGNNLGFNDIDIYLPEELAQRQRNDPDLRGASIIPAGQSLRQAESIARAAAAKDPDAFYVPASHHPLVLAGLGTLGVEIDLQMKKFKERNYAIALPAGTGTLLAGVCLSLSDRKIPIFGVQSQTNTALMSSFMSGQLVSSVPPQSNLIILTEGIASSKISEPVFSIVKKWAKDIVSVSETQIGLSMAYYHRRTFEAEGAAAAPLAAVLFRILDLETYDLPPNLPLVIVNTGENVDPTFYQSIIDKDAYDPRDAPTLDIDLSSPSGDQRPSERPTVPAPTDPSAAPEKPRGGEK